MAVKKFSSLGRSLQALGGESTMDAILAAADIALVIDRDGVIRDLAFGSDELSDQIDGRLCGHAWSETVTLDSRPKVDELLTDAAAPDARRWRQLNHSAANGSTVPVLYSAIRIGDQGNVLALGRDLRPMAAMQQRLVHAELSQERDYARLRDGESRYRLLFQLAPEALFVVDARTRRIVDANAAAAALFDGTASRLVGRDLAGLFAPDSVAAIDAMLSRIAATGSSEDTVAGTAGAAREFVLAATCIRQGDAENFIVRLHGIGRPGVAAGESSALSRLQAVLATLPDAFAVTSTDGRIITVNQAFLELAQVATEDQVRGEPLERWLGRAQLDGDALGASLRQHGAVRLYSTTLRGAAGATTDVEISAVAVPDASEPCHAFVIRNLNRHADVAGERPVHALPRSVEQLTELVGKVPMKELVRETTDVIERMCIEAALQLTQDNRASAAELLGLSRQSLYVKLRRFGLGDLGDGEESGADAGQRVPRQRS
jgi:transcriptional regulator PpsR